jgi:hypothetical protein
MGAGYQKSKLPVYHPAAPMNRAADLMSTCGMCFHLPWGCHSEPLSPIHTWTGPCWGFGPLTWCFVASAIPCLGRQELCAGREVISMRKGVWLGTTTTWFSLIWINRPSPKFQATGFPPWEWKFQVVSPWDSENRQGPDLATSGFLVSSFLLFLSDSFGEMFMEVRVLRTQFLSCDRN